jgi:hypothetical protein
VKGDELRLDFLRQIFASDDPLEITKSRIKITVRIMVGIVNLPEVALPSQHPFASVDAVSLEVHLLK